MHPDLVAELEGGRPFLFDWDLGEGRAAPIAHPHLARAQSTVRELLEEDVRAALADAGPAARALDLACNEGWWSHRLLEWGAGEVVAVEARQESAHRARLLRDHAGIGAERLEIRTADATTFDSGGPFDVVLCLGLLYHLEDPIGMLRRCRAMTRDLLVVETQVARPAELSHAWGSSDEASELTEAAFAMRWERDELNPLASVNGVVSLVPTRAALELSLHAAGFDDIRIAVPATHHMSGFRSGDRVVALARRINAAAGR